MIKRILPLIIMMFIVGCGREGIVEPESAFRSDSEISKSEVHYFDEEAIALSAASGDTASLRSEALRAYNLVNEERERAGLGTLTWDSNLESTSDVRARELEQSFSHTRPNGSAWYTVNSDIMGGENLAFGYDDANSVLDAWMDSPTHRENILYPTFTKVSITIYETDDGTRYWAQEFGY